MKIPGTRTHLAPAEVIGRARSYFPLAGAPDAAFAEVVGDGFLALHTAVGEIVIAALPRGGSTWVRGSASRGAHLLARFLTELAAPLDAKRTTPRSGRHETWPAQVETRADPAVTVPAPSDRRAPGAPE